MAALIWITGLAGSGKSLIGKTFAQELKAKYPNTIFLDGDGIREVFGNDLGHHPEDRLKNAYRIARLCHHMVHQDIHVVCATMSLYQEIHQLNRSQVKNYLEVWIEVPMEELHRRDKKGLYSAAKRGEVSHVVGIDLPYDRPKEPHLVIDNAEPNNLAQKVAQIWHRLKL